MRPPESKSLDILMSIRILEGIILVGLPAEGGSTVTTITQSVTIDRPVEEVWDFISDFENTTRWSRGVLEARQTSDGPLGVGSRLRTVVKAFGRRRTADYLVTEYEPNHVFAFEVRAGRMTSRARFSVEPAGAGTRLTASGEAHAAGLYRLLAPILVRTLERHSQDDLATVKRLLEASVAAS
jgi:carbon monoxide dehydrogenase subunit G